MFAIALWSPMYIPFIHIYLFGRFKSRHQTESESTLHHWAAMAAEPMTDRVWETRGCRWMVDLLAVQEWRDFLSRGFKTATSVMLDPDYCRVPPKQLVSSRVCSMFISDQVWGTQDDEVKQRFQFIWIYFQLMFFSNLTKSGLVRSSSHLNLLSSDVPLKPKRSKDK